MPTRSFPILAGGQFGELYCLGQWLLDQNPCGLEAPVVGHQLKPESGVPSEPCTKLVPSYFGAELCAILIVWAICHFRSERMSFVAELRFPLVILHCHSLPPAC